MSLLKHTVEVTIFKDRESGLFSLGNGIRRIEDVNQEHFEFIYRFLSKPVKARIDRILEDGTDDPNTQKALKDLYNYRNI